MSLCIVYLILPLLHHLNHAGILASLLCKNGLPQARCTDQQALQHAIDDIIDADVTRKLLIFVYLSIFVLMTMASAYTVIDIDRTVRDVRRQFRAQARLQRAQDWQQRARPQRPRA